MKTKGKKHIGLQEIICYVCVLVLAAFLISATPTPEDLAIYDSVIRLHVIANSDSEEDQALKLQVRDAVLDRFGSELAKYESVDDASEELIALRDEIESFAEGTVRSLGYGCGVTVTFTREQYPTRVYEGGDAGKTVSLPAGNYRSLRIIIGDGDGANWWCVLFPPLCLSTSYGANYGSEDSIPVGLTYEQYRLISGADEPEYVLRFKILEIFGAK